MSATIVCVGVAVTLLQPAYSTAMPQRTLLWYAFDADAGQARWILQPDSKKSAPQLQFDGANEQRAGTLPAGMIAGVHAAAAPRLDYAAPELQVIAAQPRADGVLYQLRLRSARGAPEVELAIPATLKVPSAVLIDGARRLPVKTWRAPDGTGWLDLFGSTGTGVDIEMLLPDSKPHALHLLDRSYGLPAEGASLRPAAPALTTPSQDGDLTIVYRTVTLGAGR